jgi:phosphoglycerol transferase MdoB-like AlkP superfamily enzyme
VETKNGWDYGMYDSINYMLYNYNPENCCKIDIPLTNVRTFDIRFAEEVGSGIAQIYLDNKVIDTVDLYKDTDWDYETKCYEISPIVRPYKSYSVILTLFVVGCVLVLLFDREKSVCKKTIDAVEFVGTNLVLTVVLYAVFAYMQRESIESVYIWYTESTQYFWDGFCIVFFINILLGILFRKNYVSFMLLAFVFTVFLLINNLKLQFRNMPFLPWDFIMARVVATVIGQFKITMPFAICVGAVILIAVSVVSVLMAKRFKIAKPNIVSRISIAVCTVVMFVFFMFNYLFGVTVDLFDVKNFYLERGFVGAFFENMQYLKPIEEPENYSEQKMEEIYDEITNSVPEVTENQKPNIILLMSESFWDIRRIKELNFGEEIFPNYTKLQETSTTGELLTNVYGGGTVNSEFEALTGMSVSYLPLEYMPYQRCMRPNFFSINSYLKAAGYKTLAIHPFEKTNYNRNTAYEYLGFDSVLWEDDFPEDTDRMRRYISDKALVERIIEEYEKNNKDNDSPWFNLSVSMQNHGAYWDILIDDGKDVDVDTSAFSEDARGSIKDLAIGLHYSDLALGELIDYFENVDEPTIIIMFGDHMTNAGPSGNSLLDESELLGESFDLNAAGKGIQGKTDKGVFEQRRVPFMVWSNYKTVNEDCGIVDIPRLLPTVFSKYDITMPKYFAFLKKVEDIYPACASGIVVNPDGSYNSISEMTEEQKKLYNELNLIEYDYIFGKHYIEKLFNE